PGRGRGNRSWPGPSGHVLREHLGELLQELSGRQLADQRLLEERYAFRVELASPPRVGEVRTHDREGEGLDEPRVGRIPGELGPIGDRLARGQETEGL